MIVTASRAPEPASRRAVTTIVIDRQQIKQQNARDLADLLRFHAGLDIGRNGGPGQVSSVFVRGAESNHVLVMLDGVRINPGTIGVPAIQNIDPDIVDRVEIVKGPRSSLYGSDAIGAVINVITRRDTAPKPPTFSIGTGSFDTFDIAAQTGFGTSSGGGNLAVSWHDTTGFAARTGADDKHGHDNITVNAAGWLAVDQHRAEINVWRSTGNTEYASFSLAPLDQDFINQSIDAKLTSRFGSRWTSALSITHGLDDITQNQPSFAGSFDFLTTRRLGIDWQNTVELADDNQWVLGLAGYNEQAEALSFGLPVDESTAVAAAYSQYNMHSDALDASLGARYTTHDDFGSALTWHLDVGYRVLPAVQILAAAGTGFRAPDATDRFGFGGNPTLKPEESTTLELGLRVRINDRHRVTLRAFDQNIDNLINYVVTDFITFAGINRNVDKTRTTGVEMSHEYQGEYMRVHTEAIVQRPRDDTSGATLLRRAKRSLTTNILYPVLDGTVGVSLLASGARPDIDSNTFMRVNNSGYVLANLSYSRPLARNWMVRAKVENLLDTDYVTANGFNTAGRSYFVGFSWQPRR
ncbi:MAG: TonB-dependent receptor [Gammaproteobacteria bacterium]|nr:TonB-dependent receptor [Gammaproteobacteria bacterium]